MKTFSKRILLLLGFILIIIAIRFTGIDEYINLASIQKYSPQLIAFVNDHYVLAVASFIALCCGLVVFAIPLTPLLTLASGFLFGTIPGAFYSVIGSTLGATLSFFLVRYGIGSYAQKQYGDRLKAFNKEFEKRGASYLLFLQLLPITPFGIIVMLAGLSKITWITFVWTTLVGITPGALIYAFAGRQLMTIQSTDELWTWPMIVALSLLALFAFVPVIIGFVQRWRGKSKGSL